MGDLDIKQDLNFFEYPMFIASKKACRKEGSNYVFDLMPGYKMKCSEGIPNFYDWLLLLVCLQEVINNNDTKGFMMSKNKLAEKAGRKSSGQLNKKTVEAFKKWKHTTIVYDGTFNVRKKKEGGGFFSDKVSAVFSPVDFMSEHKDKKRLYIRLGFEYVKLSQETMYYRYLPFDRYRLFKNPVAARLFDILVKSFQKSSKFKIGYKKMAAKMTLDPSEYPARIKTRLDTAMKAVNTVSKKKYSLDLVSSKKALGKKKDLFIFKLIDEDSKSNDKDVTPDEPKKTPKLPKRSDVMVPQSLLDMLPSDQVDGFITAYKKNFLDMPEPVLSWYITETENEHNRKVVKGEPDGIKNWGAWIITISKARTYEAHIMKTIKMSALLEAEQAANTIAREEQSKTDEERATDIREIKQIEANINAFDEDTRLSFSYFILNQVKVTGNETEIKRAETCLKRSRRMGVRLEMLHYASFMEIIKSRGKGSVPLNTIKTLGLNFRTSDSGSTVEEQEIKKNIAGKANLAEQKKLI